jgi:dTDP-4-amino-4,6-dideoxygalactose transaminase
MPKNDLSRRDFLKNNSVAGLGLVFSSTIPSFATPDANKPAILGGKPAATTRWIEWPIWQSETDDKLVLDVLKSGVWSRQNVVTEFEKRWAEKVGMKRSLAVVNGTNALTLSFIQSDIGIGDEVIIPAYTFIASALAVLNTGAIPVFVDTNPETFQIDVHKIETKITSRTRAIMPVHMAGLPSDMVAIMAIAKKHDLVVVEDACQAHLAEINNKKVGTWGHAGCFSFQNSKNLPIGEGGAIVSHDDAFLDRCYAYHNFGQAYGSVKGDGAVIKGSKLRLTEYQAAVGLVQMARIDAQSVTRTENAQYLKSRLEQIPGILPYKLIDGVTKASYHFFPFRYKKEHFEGLSRNAFIDALNAEGVPSYGGYGTLHDKPFLEDAFKSKNYRKSYTADMLDYKKYAAANLCPETDKLCNDEAVWLSQNLLLSGKADMDGIVSSIEKIQKNAGDIKKSSR